MLDAAGSVTVPGVSGLEPLGEGPGSVAFGGVLDRTGEPVAVKVLAAPFDRQAREQFDADRTRLGRLRHVPAILQVDDVDVLPDGRPVLVGELCADSVAALLARDDRLDAEEVAAVGSAAATALAAAHRAGVRHGRVTPANLLVRSTGQPVLADFGAALRQPAGPGEFAAPETLQDGTLSERSDLYGLGATLYAALTGRPPFPARVGEHPAERVLRVLREPAPAVPAELAPPGLAGLLADLLATRPEDRPADAAAVVARFDALLAPPEPAPYHPDPLLADLEAAEAAGEEPSALLPPPAQEPPGQAVAAGAAGVVGGGGGGDLPDLLSSGEDEPEPAGRHPRARPAAKALAGLAVVVLGTLLTRQIGSGPTPETAPAADTQPAAQPAAVELTDIRVVDRGRKVALAWQGPPGMSYAVLIAAAGQDTPAAKLVNQAKSRTFAIQPGKQYCFQIQGSFDGVHAVQSAAKGVNGARCES